jgi:hypothetical protein
MLKREPERTTVPEFEIRIRDKPHQSMRDRNLDFEEPRPTGEASHIPDTGLDEGCEGDPQRQRVATSTCGDSDAPTTVS